jgi:hypothetical protein
MRRHRLPVLLAVCAGALTLAAPCAGAASGGHHRGPGDDASTHRRAGSSQDSTSVGVRVLPLPGNPGGSGPTGTGGASFPGGGASSPGDGPSSVAHSVSDNSVSGDVDSGGQHTASSLGDQIAGPPRFAIPRSRPRFTGHRGRGHGARRFPGHGSRRFPGHGARRHGHLPFTGRNVAVLAASGAAAVLAGAVLLLISPRRRRRTA